MSRGATAGVNKHDRSNLTPATHHGIVLPIIFGHLDELRRRPLRGKIPQNELILDERLTFAELTAKGLSMPHCDHRIASAEGWPANE